MYAQKEARLTLHLHKIKAERSLKNAWDWKNNTPDFETEEEAFEYYENKVRIKKLRIEAENLLDLAIIEQVSKWKTRVEKTLRCWWSWWEKIITSILEDRSCTDISINEREVKIWLVPDIYSDIKFSVKNILEELQ